ncbi:hypothetical protein [Cyclobacterium plantarum]|uniref:Uncharacterized protein n=1 Tax=Cyclobacterium plantarum TaxID=2716263 RepID=A0ABX0HDM6_9BACT|nr:hypothetical protein [Cyclobacterium plantarum]NHE59991.1 hypothetical protein [Cyclobacterium plantarum]
MRETISPVIENARKDIESIQADFMKCSNGTLGNIYLIRTDINSENIEEKFPLLLHYDEERIALVGKNKRLNNLLMASFESTSYSG